jgi:hypothetical protein
MPTSLAAGAIDAYLLRVFCAKAELDGIGRGCIMPGISGQILFPVHCRA